MFPRTIEPVVLRRMGLGLVVAIYGLLVVLYAVNVPRWNAPDEPAHFNYIRSLAERGQLPILAAGDYDHEYLERLKAARFPPQMPIEALRYESHQPPLYYLLGAALFRASIPFGLAGQVLVLRLLSGLLGLLLLFVAYATVRRIFPGDDWLALAVPSFMAFTPMHVAVNAAIGNDPLADLILAVILWESVGILQAPNLPRACASGEREPHLPPLSAAESGAVPPSRVGKGARGLGLSFRYQRLGLWLGLALLTKTTAYAGVLVVAAAVIIAAYRQGHWRRGLRGVAGVWALALLVSGWWFLRNAIVYGPGDPFGLQRHASVAAGQPLTGGIGVQALLRFATITFQSFWGQFGWMGVLMDERVYTALAVLSLAAALGLVLYVLALWRGQRSLTPPQRAALLLLLLTLLLVATAMGQYNFTSFLQPQGRYLFPALLAIATGFVLGIRELAAPRHAPVIVSAFLLGLLALDFCALYLYVVPALRA